MPTIVIAIFFGVHGLVHLLYAGQSWRLFELRPKLVWPDGSWAFARLLGDELTRLIASISLVLAALGFVVGGIGLALQAPWWRPVIAGSAVFSSLLFFLLWDGKSQALADQGGIGVLIDVAILVIVLILKQPI